MHNEFLDASLKECLLADDRGLLKTLYRLTTTCLLFAEQMLRVCVAAEVARVPAGVAGADGGRAVERLRQTRIEVQFMHVHDGYANFGFLRSSLQIYGARLRHQTTEPLLRRRLSRSTSSWACSCGGCKTNRTRRYALFAILWAAVKKFLQYQPHLVSLAARLDYNGYYAATLLRGPP